MSDDKDPEATPDAAGGEHDADLLRRAAREIRTAKALAAFVPLAADERERLVDAAFARVDAERGTAADDDPPMPAGAPVIDLASRARRRRRSLAIALSAATALAAATALVVVRRGDPAIAPLASYAMVVEGEQATRGAGHEASTVELHPQTRLVIRLTAARPERDVLIRVVLVHDGHATLLEPSVTRAPDGALAIEATAATALGAQADGDAELVVVLGRALPDDDALRALASHRETPPPGHLQILRRPLRLVGFSHTAIDVLLGGCSAVVTTAGADPKCEVAPERPLHLWIDLPAADVALSLAGQPISAPPIARGGGTAFDLALASPTGPLAIRSGARAIATWQLAPAPVFAAIQASDAARAADRLADAASALDAIGGDAPPQAQLEAARRRAKIARARRAGADERAQRLRAVALARTLGRTSAASDETVAVLYGMRDDHAFGSALELLPTLDAPAAIYAEGAVRRDIVHALFAYELGDLSGALAAYQHALVTADRIADTVDRAVVIGPLASMLHSLGRDDEARAMIGPEIERGANARDPCARVDALTTSAWVLTDADPPRAQQLADDAVALAGARCERNLPISLINQGWAFIAAHRFAEARGVLDRLARLPTRDERITTWWVRLEGETLLGEDPARAEHHARQLAAHADALCSSELAYEAHLLRARALVALDRPDEVARELAAAEAALTVWSRLVPLGEGRAVFFQRYDQLALTAIPFFVARARHGAPAARRSLAAIVRRSLARFVTSLAEDGRALTRADHAPDDRDRAARQLAQTGQRWPVRLAAAAATASAVDGVCELRAAAERAAAPALDAPPTHPAVLVHPSPRGWLVVTWRGAAIELAEIDRVADEPPGALADRIAHAAAPALAGVDRVHLYVHRALAALAIDRRLAALVAAPIAFAVDAPPPPTVACHAARRALVVSNPRDNLWAASAALPALRRALERLGFVVESLEGAAATRAAIAARLADPCTQLLHYDGHGVATAARRDRADDALLLAHGDRLTAADVLALPHAPADVVLNGCTTAAPEGLGLAQAWLLAGASRVVASLDDLPAEAAAAFAERLYTEGAPSATTGIDLVALFWRAITGKDLPALRAFER